MSRKFLEINGITKSASQWILEKESTITESCLIMRHKNQCPHEKLFLPARPKKHKHDLRALPRFRGHFLYGLPLCSIPRHLRLRAQMEGSYEVPNEADHHCIFLSSDRKSNIHRRKGFYYYVVDGKISKPFKALKNCKEELDRILGNENC